MNIYDIIKWNKTRFNPMSKTNTKQLLLSMMQHTQEMVSKLNTTNDLSKADAADKEYLQLVNDNITSLLSYGKNVFFDNSHLTHTFTTKSFPNGKVTAVIHNINDMSSISSVHKIKDGEFVYIKNSDEFREIHFGNAMHTKASLSFDDTRAKNILHDYCYIADHPYGVKFCTKNSSDKAERYYDITQLVFLANTLCNVIEFAFLTENYPDAIHLCKVAEEVSDQFPVQIHGIKNLIRIAIYANVLFELDKARQELLKDMRVESELE